MALVAEVCRFRAWNRLRDVAADGDRHDPILVAVPDVHARLDVFGPEVPLAREHPNVLRYAAAAVPEALQQCVAPEPPHTWPIEDSWVGPRRHAIGLRTTEAAHHPPRRHRRPRGRGPNGERVERPLDDVFALHVARSACRGAADDRRANQPTADVSRPGQRVRPTAGEPDDREAVDAERIGELDHVGGPVAQHAASLERRAADPGAVDRDKTYSERSCRFVSDHPFEPGAGGAVEIED